jgi:hypothetical protein
MEVGDEVWLFDINRRVYDKSSYSPVYSEHFYKARITGETTRSWIVNGIKYSKKNPLGLFTDQQKDDAVWADANRYKIIDLLKTLSTEKLKEVSKILSQL